MCFSHPKQNKTGTYSLDFRLRAEHVIFLKRIFENQIRPIISRMKRGDLKYALSLSPVGLLLFIPPQPRSTSRYLRNSIIIFVDKMSDEFLKENPLY